MYSKRWIHTAVTTGILSLLCISTIYLQTPTAQLDNEVTIRHTMPECVDANTMFHVSVFVFDESLTNIRKNYIRIKEGSQILRQQKVAAIGKSYAKFNFSLSIAKDQEYTIEFLDEEKNLLKSETASVNVIMDPEATISSATCKTSGNGSILLKDNSEYSYSWSTGDTGPEITQLHSGSYTVTVTTDNGCVKSFEYSVFEETIPYPDFKKIDLQCDGQTETILIASIDSKEELSYKWNAASSNDWSSSPALRISSDKVYQLDVQTADGCISSFTTQSADAESLAFKSNDVIIYSDKKLNDSWYNYDLNQSLDLAFGDLDNDGSNGSVHTVSFHNSLIEAELGINKLNTDYYSEPKTIYAKVQSTLACYDVAEITLAVAAPTSVILELEQNVFCDIEESVKFTGGFPEGGIYILRSCTQKEDCPEILISPDENNEYLLQSLPGEGDYQLEYRYTNESGIVNSAYDQLTITSVNFDFQLKQDIICTNENRIEIATSQKDQIITGVGVVAEENEEFGLSYYFDPSGLAPGIYSIKSLYIYDSKIDSYKCDYRISKEIELVSSPEIRIDINSNEFCSGENISLNATVINGAAEPRFNWFFKDSLISQKSQFTLEDVNPTDSGTYYLEIENGFGCNSQESVTIQIRPEIKADIVEQRSISCYGESDGILRADLEEREGNYTYLWNNGNTKRIARNVSAGTYQLTISDDLNCSEVVSFTLEEPAPLAIQIQEVNPVSCFGSSDGKIQALVDGGTAPYDIDWSTGNKTMDIASLLSGTYKATITDQQGCTKEATYFLDEPQPLSIAVDAISHISCHGDKDGQANISVKGGNKPYQISWDNGESKSHVSSMDAGNHHVTVTDANGCESNRTIHIEQPEQTTIEIIQLKPHPCGAAAAGGATLRVTGPSTYAVKWDNGETGMNASQLLDGTHIVTITDEEKCEVLQEVKIELQVSMVCEARQLTSASCVTAANGSALVESDRSIAAYQWDNGETTALAKALSPGNHQVILTDENGCQSSCTVNIDVASPIQLACNNLINYSLPGDCQFNFSPEIVMENYTRYFEYDLALTDEAGAPVDTFNMKNYVGQTLDYVLTENCKRSSCWGKINLEDKLGPQLNCHTRTINCSAHMDDLDSMSMPIQDISNHWYTDYGVLEVQSLIDCSLIELSFEDQLQSKSCDNPFSHIVQRTWSAADEFGNTSQCTQQINIFRDDIHIHWPNDTSYVYCMREEFDTESHPDMDPKLMGKPVENGLPENYQSHTSPCAIVDYIYYDQLVPICYGEFKILREWVALQECTGFEERYTQTIFLNAAPYSFEQQDTIVKIETGFDCKTDMILPLSSSKFCGKISSYAARVYSEMEMENCQVYLEKPVSESLELVDENMLLIPDLEIGCNYIEVYLATDCHVRDTISFYVTVIDHQAPVLICDAETVVSLGSDGIGFLVVQNIDNGSWDNCGIASISLIKQDSICALDSLSQINDKLTFCCAEIGDQVMVTMTVTDLSENMSTCEVIVHIEENAFPHIECPDNRILACTVDLEDVELTGFPVSEQLCAPLDFHYNDASEYNECRNETIERNWYAYVRGDSVSVCTQTIQLFNELPFTAKNIEWPKDVVIDGCTANLTVEYLGQPIIDTLESCQLIATNYIDKEFDASLGSCISILREWTIIDWCQFNEKEDGIWRKSQLIKINDSVNPTISCAPMEACLNDRDCVGDIDLTVLASDDCSSVEDLLYHYEIDIHTDGSIDQQKDEQTKDLTFNLPIGTHAIKLYVNDLCQNVSSCETELIVKDCEAPTPYCIAQTVSTIFNEHAEVEVWATDFNLASRDNCTEDEDLEFSFAEDTLVNVKRFDCEDVIRNQSSYFELSVWVKDESGNQDACLVSIRIDQHESSTCDSVDLGSSFVISGKLVDVNGENLPDVEVQIADVYDPDSAITQLTQNGDFEMTNAVKDSYYEIAFRKEASHQSGISTADMIALQNHLIGLHEISSEYKRIAADVNRDGRLSSVDLILLKQIIIGQIDKLPGVESPWIFKQLNSNSLNQISDFEFVTDAMVKDANFDIVGIKIGDIDGSAMNLQESEIREENDLNEVQSVEAKVYPNPFMDELRLSFTMHQTENINITIIDNSGKVCRQITQVVSLGEHVIEVENAASLPAGLLYVIFEQGYTTEAIKIMKI